ncbi:MAG: dicarboxylate/amino acid:cation symporter [Synergistaceae bacterium]|nr:dicarboxylate/amino acid:cation symporter [Synergistaceae bacterium]
METITYRTAGTSMLIKIAVGFFLGILFGFLAAPLLHDTPLLSNHIMPFLDLSGQIFLRLLTMVIVPLVFSSLIASIAIIGDTKKLGRIGAKTVALFLVTTFIAVFVGIVCANLFKPGSSIDIPPGLHSYSASPKPIRDVILDIFPVNPIAAMVNADMLQIIVFALFCGIACLFAGETGKRIAVFFGRMSELMEALTSIVMWFAPYGVFALMATTAADFGLSLVKPFAKIIAAVYVGCAVHALAVYSLMIAGFCRKSPSWFFKGVREAAITAFVTRSSAVTLPVTMENVRHNLGVSKEISSFVLPLGATINMDGTAIYQVVCALFVARAFNIPMTFSLYVSIIVAATLASIGAAGVPGAGLVMLAMVLTSSGLPVEGVGLVAGIDVVLSSARTFLNVMGDAAVCAVVASSEGEDLTQDKQSGRMPAVNYGA